MSKKEIIKLIAKYGEEDDFSGNISYEHIQQIEVKLNVILPDSYKWFIKTFGHGGVAGIEVLGVTSKGVSTTLKTTLNYRRYGLPPAFVVIENVDEWLYCLDTSRMNNKECPVVDWDCFGNVGKEEFSNFYEFLLERFAEAIENL
ncbi:SMI1/KNR4 family protein [Paludifilum halophilum]|uniref:SMI1/KNR4 family protein n=1 Tax=Paludifilum halophilum TaxID=1642702 RepID=UPI00146C509B|nr:SMI1/KNR4 family protein [Paludifilum halophilum]